MIRTWIDDESDAALLAGVRRARIGAPLGDEKMSDPKPNRSMAGEVQDRTQS